MMKEGIEAKTKDEQTSAFHHRLDHLDIAKGLGVLFVLFGHLFTYGGKASTFIFSFHMPLFFVISGMCFNLERDGELGNFIARRFKSLVIPYFLYCVVGFVFSCVVPGMWIEGTSVDSIVTDVFYLAAPNIFHVGQVWFLINLFFVEVFGFVINKLVFSRIDNKLLAIVIMLLLIYCGANTSGVSARYFVLGRFPWMLDTAITSTVFYIVGLLAKRWGVVVNPHGHNKRILFAISLVLFGTLAFISINYLGWVNIANLAFNNLFFYYMCAILGTIATIMLSMGLSGLKLADPIRVIGRNSLFLFAIHSIFLELLSVIASKVYGYQIIFGQNMPNETVVLGGVAIGVLLTALGYFQNLLRKRNAGRKLPLLSWMGIA